MPIQIRVITTQIRQHHRPQLRRNTYFPFHAWKFPMCAITSIIQPQMLKGATPKCSHQLLASLLILAEKIHGWKRSTTQALEVDLRSRLSVTTPCATSFHTWAASKRQLVSGFRPAIGSASWDRRVMPGLRAVISTLECHEFARLPRFIFCRVNCGRGNISMHGVKESNYRRERRRTI